MGPHSRPPSRSSSNLTRHPEFRCAGRALLGGGAWVGTASGRGQAGRQGRDPAGLQRRLSPPTARCLPASRDQTSQTRRSRVSALDPEETPAAPSPSRIRGAGAPSSNWPKVRAPRSPAEELGAGQSWKTRGSRRLLLARSEPGRERLPGALSPKTERGGREQSALPPLAEAPGPGDWRSAWSTLFVRPGLAAGSPAGGGLAPRRPLLLQPPPPPGMPLLPRPRLPGPRAARPPARLRKAVGPSASPPGAPRPGPATPAARVASSVPAAASPSSAPGPAAAATRGRGLAARVGRAAADGAGIKGRPREQLVAARPAPALQAAWSS
ncbi:uncharacterized protein LOC100386503 isoform X2 [Callithrix jacchus]